MTYMADWSLTEASGDDYRFRLGARYVFSQLAERTGQLPGPSGDPLSSGITL
jgi:hypothetical protein